MKIEYLTSGCALVYSGKEGILIGAVSEAIKYLQHRRLSEIRIRGIWLTRSSHTDGISNWAIEFPLYQYLFVHDGLRSGKRLRIYGDTGQLERARTILRLTLLGPTHQEYRRYSREYPVSHKWYSALERVSEALAIHGSDGSVLTIDELVEFVDQKSPIIELGPDVYLTEMVVSGSGPESERWILQQRDRDHVIDLDFCNRPKAPYPVPLPQELPNPGVFRLRNLFSSNGFDSAGGNTAMILELHGNIVLWDTGAFLSEALTAHGISVADVAGVFLTHLHEDHCNILEIREKGNQLRLYTTPEIYEGLIVKLACQLGIDPETEREVITGMFDFHPLFFQQECHVFGATFVPHPCVHSIPAFGGRFVVEREGRRHELLISGDTVGADRLEQLKSVLPNRWYRQMRDMITGAEDLVIYDGGGDPAGLHPDPREEALQRAAERMGDRLWFGHRSQRPGDYETWNTLKPGQVFDLGGVELPPDDYGRFQRALARLAGDRENDMDQRDVRTLFAQGKAKSAAPGELVIEEGHEADDFYVLLAGSLEIYNSRLGHLADLSGGTCFGETALLDNQPRNATVRAMSAARLWQVPAKAFVAFVETYGLHAGLRDMWRNRRLLANVDIFRQLPADVLDEVAIKAETLDLDAGSTLIREGHSTREFYVLVSGEMQVTRSGQLLGVRGPRSLLGEAAALQGEPRTATLKAVSACQLLRFPPQMLHQMLTYSMAAQVRIRTLVTSRK